MFKSNTASKIASNTIYQIVGKVISMSITVLATMLITRNYGRELYGEFSLMQTWPALFFIIVDFGINAVATREISKSPELADKYVGNILILRSLFSLLLMGVLGFAMLFFPYSAHLKLGIFLSLFLLLTQAFYATTNIVFQVKMKYDYSTFGYVGGYILILGLILICSLLHLDVVFVSFSYVIGGLVTFLINYGLVKKLGVIPELKLDKSLIKSLLISSLPLGLMFVFSQINFKADSILISVLPLPSRYGLSNTESVALYSLPYKIFEVALVIPTFFMNSTYPVLVKHFLESKEKLAGTFKKVISFLLGAGILCGLAGVALASFAISLLGGGEFLASTPVLQILLGGLVLYFLTQPIAWLIVTLGDQKDLPMVYLISAAFNVVANVIFIQKYSFYASAVITHLSEFLILVMLVFVARKAWHKKYA